MSSLNVAEIVVLIATLVAPLAGLVELTVGGVVSGGTDMEKDVSFPYVVPALFCATIL